MSTNDSKAPLRQVKRVQFGILSPDEIVSITKMPLMIQGLLLLKLFTNNI